MDHISFPVTTEVKTESVEGVVTQNMQRSRKTPSETVSREENLYMSENDIKVEEESVSYEERVGALNAHRLCSNVSEPADNSTKNEHLSMDLQVKSEPVDNEDQSYDDPVNPMTAVYGSVCNYPMSWPSQEQDLSYAASVNHPQCIDGLPNYRFIHPQTIIDNPSFGQQKQASTGSGNMTTKNKPCVRSLIITCRIYSN